MRLRGLIRRSGEKVKMLRVLYVINTGLLGGLQAHVKCLMQSLADVAETAVVINTEIDPKVVSLFEDAGLKLYRLRGTSGHDWRVVGRFKKVLEDFKPDVVHAHGLPFLVAVWMWWQRLVSATTRGRVGYGVPVIHSLHTLPQKPKGIGRLEWFVLDRLVDYYLPVSTFTRENFTKYHPRARGEVFFNPLRLSDFPPRNRAIEQSEQSNNFTVGMVGRNADVKDWPSFHKVEEIVKEKLWAGVGGERSTAQFVNLEPGDTFDRIEQYLRQRISETFENRTLGISASIGSKRNANELAKHLAAGESPEAHKFAAKNIGALFERGVVGFSHLDKKALPTQRWITRFVRVVSSFDFAGERFLATLTLKAESSDGRLYAVEAVEIKQDVKLRSTPRGAMSKDLNSAPILNLTSQLRKRIAYYVGDVNRTHPAFLGRSEPFSIARVADMISEKTIGAHPPLFASVSSPRLSFLNAGEKEVCNGREAIDKMDLFVMTSKHEQLPTTVLECFAIGTPICGFIPVGGTTDILGFSKGPVREAFIAERSCEKLADIVLDLMAHPEKRQALAEDGRQILENHFDAEKNCCGRLMEIYREHVK